MEAKRKLTKEELSSGSDFPVEDIMERLSNHARAFLEKDGYVEGMFHAFKADGTGIVLPVTYRDEAEKTLFLGAVKEIFRREKVVRYFMVTEAWMAARKPEDDENPYYPKVMPRDDPNRIETVIIDYVSYDKTVHRVFEMKRDEEGNYQSLEPRFDLGNEKEGVKAMSGRMLQLLPPIQETKLEKKLIVH